MLEDFAVSLETQQGILTASFSPDGKRVITGGFMNAAIWDASDGKEIFKLKGLEDYVSQTLFSHDGKKVVTGSLDGSAIIWDAASGKQIVVLKKVSMMKGTNRAVTALSLNPDDTMAVIRSGGLIGLWDVALGKNIKSDGYGMNTVWAASFTPSGIKFIGGTGGRTASIYTFYSNDHFIGPLNGHTDSIRSADFSHDGTKVVTGSDDSTAKIWNASSGTEILTLKGHDRFVSAASFSSDGTKVITGSGDNTAKIWDTVSGKQILTLKGHKGKILTVS
ncbi:MAG: WD40 repeat domain-containing protein, partial [Proteobacteria bacterium]|nr:WD40 repeat domain-containing protein [Pseudomonadota bacterium]